MVFSFFWVFYTSLLNEVEHTWLKFQLHICNSELNYFFVNEGLYSKLKYYGPCKIS
jgi:hypothetical protein